LTARFDPEDVTGKARGKAAVLAELELDAGADVPLLAMVGGVEPPEAAAVATAIGRALRGEVVVAVCLASSKSGVLGEAIERLAKTYPQRIAARFGANEAMLHRVLAAADLSLVVDPAGATATPARAAMRYGSVPIVLRTPATSDAAVDAESSLAS